MTLGSFPVLQENNPTEMRYYSFNHIGVSAPKHTLFYNHPNYSVVCFLAFVLFWEASCLIASIFRLLTAGGKS